MLRCELEQYIIETFLEFIAPEKRESVTINTKISDSGVDSLSFITLIVQLEEYYDIEFEDEYLEEISLKDIKSIVEMVKGLV